MIFLLLAMAAPAQDVPVQDAPAQAVAPAAFGADARLESEELGRETAREDVAQIATANQSAGVANNSINGPSTTGQISIDGNAFQNASGLTIINANSGNNVAINASLNVNLRLTPGQ